MEETKEWTKVRSRRNKGKVYVKKSYWNGFNRQGNENWYLELSDGRILTPIHEDYAFWYRRFRVQTA